MEGTCSQVRASAGLVLSPNLSDTRGHGGEAAMTACPAEDAAMAYRTRKTRGNTASEPWLCISIIQRALKSPEAPASLQIHQVKTSGAGPRHRLLMLLR